MKTAIHKFVSLNRKACRYLESALPNFFGYNKEDADDLTKNIDAFIREESPKKILEAGGTDRPLISRSEKYRYYGLDIEDKQSCYDLYDHFLVQSIEDDINEKFDLIISLTLLEHVPNNKKSIDVVYRALAPGGATMHYVPSKNHFYSIILRLIGPSWQKRMIGYLRPDSEDVTGYPAFFDRCSPAEMEQLFRSAGFSDVEIIPYYRATDYFAFFAPAFVFVAVFENIFEWLNLRYFASGMVILARK